MLRVKKKENNIEFSVLNNGNKNGSGKGETGAAAAGGCKADQLRAAQCQ